MPKCPSGISGEVEVIPTWVQVLSDQDARRTAAEMQPVLQAATERVHYAEARRGQYVAVAGGLFAGAIALASIAGQEVFERLTWAVGVVSGGFFLLSIFLFFVYSKQINRYPWTSATKTWKWFYRDALPDQAKFDVRFFDWLLRWDKEVARAKGEFNRQLPSFGDSLMLMADPRESLWQDIQQLYVLHVNEKYKNAYLSELRSILNGGLVITLLFAVMAGVLQLLMAPKDYVRTTVASERTNVVLAASKFEGSDCRGDCWLANVTASNESPYPAMVEIGTKGSGCLMLPADDGNPFLVEAGRTAVHSIYFVCANSSPALVSIAVNR